MKPILFNTEMVQAILSGRKTTTRRIVKPQPVFLDGETGTPEPCDDGNWCFKIDQYRNIYDFDLKPLYQRGDILYVRETWRVRNMFGDWSRGDRCAEIEFRAKGGTITLRNIDPQFEKWQKGARWLPAIHMPKNAARIFLRVTNVKLERLQSITESDARKEGVLDPYHYCSDDAYWKTTKRNLLPANIAAFSALWDSTVRTADQKHYGWDVNPWVWVFEYELYEAPKTSKM